MYLLKKNKKQKTNLRLPCIQWQNFCSTLTLRLPLSQCNLTIFISHSYTGSSTQVHSFNYLGHQTCYSIHIIWKRSKYLVNGPENQTSFISFPLRRSGEMTAPSPLCWKFTSLWLFFFKRPWGLDASEGKSRLANRPTALSSLLSVSQGMFKRKWGQGLDLEFRKSD